MISRSIIAAWLCLGLPGGVPQVGERPADPPRGTRAGGQGSASARPENRSADAAPHGAGAPDAKPSPTAGDRTRRVRELIYFFRSYRVFIRDEEWAQTIRELATIGKDAVPELIAELDRTDRDATIRSLAFALRAIGDPRAVPALIRAIPKALRPPGSDCGVGIADPDLRAFMRAHQNYKDDQSQHVAVGRPVNEILSALERITRHREPPEVGDNDPLRHVFLGGNPEQQARQRAQFEERRKRWETWWSDHSKEFATPDELRSAELPRRDEDLVEQAGLARYGPRFPTGPGVRLGPVRMLRLTRSVYHDAKSHLDLDAGRVFALYEGLRTADWGRPEDLGAGYIGWYRRNGIDIRCQGPVEGVDLLLWLVDDRRWDTIEAEIQKGGPLPLGRETTSYLVRFDKSRTDFKEDELATFLFTTREGGRGIIQVFPKDRDTDRYRIRYRMWATPSAGPAGLAADHHPTVRPRGTPLGKVVTARLERPAKGRAFLLDLETGRKAAPPDFVKAQEIANGFALTRNDRFTRWCREQGIDVIGRVITARGMAAAPKRAKAEAEPARRESPWSPVGPGMVAARVLPQAFEEMTVEEVREVLGRMPAQGMETAWMGIDTDLAERPDTFAFRTREGTVGLLQLEEAEGDAGELTIRYRLGRRD